MICTSEVRYKKFEHSPEHGFFDQTRCCEQGDCTNNELPRPLAESTAPVLPCHHSLLRTTRYQESVPSHRRVARPRTAPVKSDSCADREHCRKPNLGAPCATA